MSNKYLILNKGETPFSQVVNDCETGFCFPVGKGENLSTVIKKMCSYLSKIKTEETDPYFRNSVAHDITAADITNWDLAYSWGDHAGLYAPISHTHSLLDLTQSNATTGQVPVWNGTEWEPQTIGGGGGGPESDPVFTAWLSGVPNLSEFNNDVGYLISVGLGDVLTVNNDGGNIGIINIPSIGPSNSDTAIDITNRILKTSNASSSVNWETRELIDGIYGTSVDWYNRRLIDPLLNNVITWDNGVVINGLLYPSSDGSNGYVLTTDGFGTLTFAPISETDPIYTASSWFSTTNNSSDWDAAFSWGDHSLAGYLTVESDPVFSAWLSTPPNVSIFTNDAGYTTLSSFSAGTGISYNNLTGVITNSAPDQTVSLTAGTGVSVTGTYPNFTITNSAPSTLSGSGTTNYLPKWSGASSLTDSQIFDNGTNVGINRATPNFPLDVNGEVLANGGIRIASGTGVGNKTGIYPGSNQLQFWAGNGNIAQFNLGGGAAGITNYVFTQGLGRAIGGSDSVASFRIAATVQSSLVANTVNFTQLLIDPQYIQSTFGSGILRGVYYNPILTSLNGSTHRAWENTSGDIVFGNLAGVGTRMVTASATGQLSTQSIPTGDVSTSGSYANPSWITSLAWSKITGTPTTLSGYGITDAFPLVGGSLTGTAGAGFFGAIAQSSNPPTPVSGFRLFANSSHAFSWIGQNGYIRTFDGTANTADRIYTLPNISGTLPLGTGTTNELTYWSGTNTISTLTTATYPSLTELSYVKGVTSAIQTQFDSGRENHLIRAYAAMGSTVKAQSLGMGMHNIGSAATIGATNNSRLTLIAIYLETPQTITGVKWYQGTLGSYTANNENRVGLYTVSGGTLTLVASCANDGNLWQTVASNTFGAKAFSSTYAASPGLYYIGLLYSNSAVTTAPTIGISSNVVNSNVQSGDFSNGLGLQLVKTTVVALPSSITASTYTQVQQQYWAAIY